MISNSAKAHGFARSIWALLILVILLVAFLAAVPPVSKDALVHHLAVPKIYLRHGGMVELPSMPFSYYPANLELLYWGALALGSDILPKYIHFAFALTTAWFLFRYLKRKLSPVYGALGALFFLSVPIIVKLSITVYIDLGVICFTFCAVLFLFEWIEKGMGLRYLAASALFCGLAVGTKYNGLIALFLLTLSVPFFYARRGPAVRGRSIRAIGLAAGYFLAAVLVCSPYLVRNYQWTGNPLHPLYKQWFTASSADGNGGLEETLFERVAPQKVRHGMFTYRRLVYGESGWEIALLPLRIFFQGEDGSPQYFDGRLHPFLLILPLLAFMRSRDGPDAERLEKGYLLAFAVLFFAFALFSQVLRIRYIGPIIPPLVILSVFGVRNLLAWIRSVESRPARWVAGFVFLSGMAVLAAYSADYLVQQVRKVQPWSYLSGELSRDAYISTRRPEYPVMQYANRNIPEDAKILLTFMGRRGYYLDRDYVPGVARLGALIGRAEHPEEALRTLRRQGITHLLVFLPIFETWVGDNLDEGQQRVAKRFFERYTEPLCVHRGYALFALEHGYPEASS